MAALFRRAMDYLYLLCVIIGCIALVAIPCPCNGRSTSSFSYSWR